MTHELLKDACCGNCAFCFSGKIVNLATAQRGKRSRYVDGWHCCIRPPTSDRLGATTSPDRVCALFLDAETLKQPLRFALPNSLGNIANVVAEVEAAGGGAAK